MSDNAIDRRTDAITIRSITPSDREQWEPLYRQYADFYRTTVTDAIVARVWSWLLDAEHPEAGIVAELANGELVGIAHFRPFPETLTGQDVGFLDDLFVSPNHRGQGIARDLIAAVATIARERGWSVLRWITAQDNIRARRIYDGMAQATTWVTYDMSPSATHPET